MRNYIKAELYRIFRMAYYRNVIIIISLMCFAYQVLLPYADLTLEWAFIAANMMLIIPMFILLVFPDQVVIYDFKDGTIRNPVASGMAREKIIIGKIITGTIIAIIAAIIILTSYYGSAIIFLKPGDSDIKLLAKSFFVKLMKLLPIWIAGISIGTFLGIVVKANFLFGLSYIGIISIIPNILGTIGDILNSQFLISLKYSIGLNEIITRIVSDEHLFQGFNIGSQYMWDLFVAISYFLVFSLMSIIVFKKKDL